MEKLSEIRKFNPLDLTEELNLENKLKEKYFDKDLKDILAITLNELAISSFVIEKVKLI